METGHDRTATAGEGYASSETERKMMSRALELAAKGVGQVSPGPLVGCVIVTSEGKIAGEGYYVQDQIQHAETIALAEAGSKARDATAYVSLEPHAHQARTSPCTVALIEAGIKRVIAPIEDPNPKVSGSGFAHLRAAGVEVSTGVMAHEASVLNEKYIHYMRTGRPFVHLKLAVSLDGKVATRTGDSRWITGEEARARVQELRHEYDAIVVGGGTVRADNPLLTDRSQKPRRRPLTRVVIDQNLRTTPQSQLAQTAAESPVLIFSDNSAEKVAVDQLTSLGVDVIRNDGNIDLFSVLDELGNRDIQSVLVEGGAVLAGLLLDAKLVDKITFFIAPLIVGGTEAPSAIAGAGAEMLANAVQLDEIEIRQHGRDVEITGYPA